MILWPLRLLSTLPSKPRKGGALLAWLAFDHLLPQPGLACCCVSMSALDSSIGLAGQASENYRLLIQINKLPLPLVVITSR